MDFEVNETLKVILNGQTAMRRDLLKAFSKFEKTIDKINSNDGREVGSLSNKLDKFHLNISRKLDRISIALSEKIDKRRKMSSSRAHK